MKKDYWKQWFKYAAIRAIKTFCQGLLALIGANQVSIVELDWPTMLGISATMALASLLTSVVGIPEVKLPEVEGEEGGDSE